MRHCVRATCWSVFLHGFFFVHSSMYTMMVIIMAAGDNAAALMGGKSDYCPWHPVSLFDGMQVTSWPTAAIRTDNPQLQL